MSATSREILSEKEEEEVTNDQLTGTAVAGRACPVLTGRHAAEWPRVDGRVAADHDGDRRHGDDVCSRGRRWMSAAEHYTAQTGMAEITGLDNDGVDSKRRRVANCRDLMQLL